MTKIKRLAKTTNMPKRQLVLESVTGIKRATAAQLPNEKQIGRIIERIRQDPKVLKNPYRNCT